MGWLDVINVILDHILDRNSDCLTDALLEENLEEYRRLIEHNPRLINMPDSSSLRRRVIKRYKKQCRVRLKLEGSFY